MLPDGSCAATEDLEQLPPLTKSQLTSTGAVANRDLLLPYLAPYGAYVLTGSLAGDLGHELDYAIRIIGTGGLLLAFRSRYQRLFGPRPWQTSVLVGCAAGVVGVFLWIAFLLPFQDAHAGEPFAFAAFLLRLSAAALIAPFAEELLCRGYILGVVTQWQEARRSGKNALDVVLDERSVQELPPGSCTWLAALVSSAAFALGHGSVQWLAAFAYGLLMAGLWRLRRDLITPLTAHAVTNIMLYVFVFTTGNWGLW